jgi:hypothetical protein
MLTDASLPYRWQDHVITPKRAASSLKATALIVAVIVIAADLFGAHAAEPPTHAARATEQTPPLAHLAKPVVSPNPRSASLDGC